MEFLLGDNMPENIPGEYEKEVVFVDRRTVATIEEAQKKHWYTSWFEGGTKHREEKGMIACNKINPEKRRLISLNSLEELILLQEGIGPITIDTTTYLNPNKEIRKEYEY